MALAKYGDLTLVRAVQFADPTDPNNDLLRGLAERIEAARPEQERFRGWCDRADALYYAEEFTDGGADLWADHPSATTPGMSHVSVNTPAIYVDVPAALQAVDPIENMVANDNTEEARAAASAEERLYTSWKATEKFDLKWAKACTVKGLYGRTAGKVYWDRDETPPRPCIEIVEQPRNLFLGYRSTSYEHPEWAAYVEWMDPNAVLEEFGYDVTVRDSNGLTVPFVEGFGIAEQGSRAWVDFGPAKVEVWDYWYREPAAGKHPKGKPVKMETWNVVFAGNVAVREPTKYPEYEGKIPYIPVFNTFIPGYPDGRADLYDVEPLIREKFEKITAGSQMIAAGVAGDYWQVVGSETAQRFPPGLKPTRNQVINPGSGNRIETITPFIMQFQLEQFLGRIDRELATISGLNDLQLGLVPSQGLSSSKAINALISNYENHIAMRRMLLYAWRRSIWEMVRSVWSKKDATVRKVLAAGGTLDIISPSLNPRDELETATRALNLVNGKLWSQRRGQDAVGVDDPETEQEMISEERTNATMFPAEVMQMAQLMSTLKSLGLQVPGDAQGQAQQQLASGQNDLRTALGAATPDNTTSSQLPGDQGMMPPEGLVPGATPPAAPFAQGPQPDMASLRGSMTATPGGITNKTQLITQRQLGRR